MTRYIILIQDVTESERLEQTRRDYVANVSHELKTPIASIRSLAETLSDGMVKNDNDKVRYYEYILRESMRLSRLIDDLLELSRLQSGSIALTKQSFYLEGMIESVSERMKLIADDSEIRLEYEESVLPSAYSNPDRIEQALVSLTDNAIKYSDDGGMIRIHAIEKPEHIIVEVRNTGHVNESDLPHLFERFYKADKSHTGLGTGLGLAITKEVLELLGESISVKNDAGEVVFAFTVHKEPALQK